MAGILFSADNPYHITGPVKPPQFFVGRQDLISWVWHTLRLNERIILICGSPLIGKSSLLLQLQHTAPTNYLAVYADLMAPDKPTADSLSTFVIQQVHQRLLAEAQAGGGPITPSAPAAVWKALREHSPGKRPLLLLDNLDRVLLTGDQPGWAFLDDLSELMTWHPDLQVVIAVRAIDLLRRIDRLPFARAPWRRLEPLARAEAVQLIKYPVEGRLEYDYEAVERIDELTGRLPYYIQLLCGQLFEQRRHAGRVGIVDLEPAIKALGEVSIPPFQELWDEATPEGKLILSLLGSLKGSSGVTTQAEIIAGLRGMDIAAEPADVTHVIGQLVNAGALHQLGALSYRFSVDLFRHWVRARYTPQAIAARYRWQTQRSRPARPQPEEETEATPKPRKWPLSFLISAATVLVALGLAFIPWGNRPAVQPTPTSPLPLATMAAILLATPDHPISTPISTPIEDDTPTPTATYTPTPTASPTATRPVVLARVVPAIAFMRKTGQQPWQIWLVAADGTTLTKLSDGKGDDTGPAWSPDGRRIAFVSERDGNKEIYVMNNDGSNVTNLTRHPSDDWTPAWSPDGTEIAFASMRDGNWEIYVMWSDGSAPYRLTHDPRNDFAPAWSPDGRRIAFASNRDGDYDIYVMNRDGTNLKQLTNVFGSDLSPAWSPDGRYIAFESSRDGNAEIYVMRADGSEQTNLTNMRGANDHWPTWSPDGKKIAFCSNRGGRWNLWVMSADGSDPRPITEDADNDQGPAWRP